jgi:uncharacterized protein YoxC
MNGIVLACIILVTVSVIIMAVYFIILMVQLTQTAKEAEDALKKVNAEMEQVQKISSTVRDTLNFVPKAWVKVASSVLPVLMTTLFRRKK